MKKANKIWLDAEEKFLATVIVYAQADDGKVFYDDKFKEEVPKAELMNLLVKDLVLVHHNGEFFKPANFSDKTTHIEVNVENETGWLTFKSGEVSA